MAHQITQYINAHIFDGHRYLSTDRLTTINGVVQAYDTPLLPGAFTVDCQNQLLTAAFIDLQKYGGGRLLFAANPSPAALQALAAENRLGGVVHCMVTIPTMPIDVAYTAIDAIADYWQQGGEGILGLHLEGPFINPDKRGAHILDWIQAPTLDIVEALLAHRPGILKMVTLAPECCSDAVVQCFVNAGVVVSAGHSNASYQQATDFTRRGIHLVTHLFNAMSPLHHRNGGIPAAAMLSGSLVASIIPDGLHVSYEALQLAKAMMGERLFYITDAVTPTQGGAYPHQLNGDAYYMPDGTLSGSAISMWQGVRNGVAHAGIALEESIRMASLYPAKALGLAPLLGSIAPGMAPGLLLLSKKGNVEVFL